MRVPQLTPHPRQAGYTVSVPGNQPVPSKLNKKYKNLFCKNSNEKSEIFRSNITVIVGTCTVLRV
jgi:hypothetical protein